MVTRCYVLLLLLQSIFKSFVVRVYDLIKDPRMLVAIRIRYVLT